jgi:hypothetical protein
VECNICRYGAMRNMHWLVLPRAVNEFRFDRVSFRFVVTKWLTKQISISFIKRNG